VEKAREKMIVNLFMDGANKGFKPLMRDLENDYVLGTNNYPATLAEALQVLMVYLEQPVGNHEKVEEAPVSGNRKGRA
jgi:hypothetical protein